MKLAALLLTLLLAACALPQKVGGEAPPPDRELHRELIQTMLAQEQYYAALAHIQAAQAENGPSDELRYLEAEARRKLGQYRDAEALYSQLGNSRYAAEAAQGLGLSAAARGDFAVAVGHLRRAAQRRPADPGLRNDLGYALLKLGRYAEARPELSTALELEPANPRARNNLVLLLLLTKDETGAKKLAAESGLSADALARLKAQAQSWNTPKKAAKARSGAK